MPRTYFITRHPGAVEWAREHGFGDAICVAHADAAFFAALQPEDAVIGILPVNLAARVCAAGAKFFCLSIDIPPELRGKELSAEQMRACNARVERFTISAIRNIANSWCSQYVMLAWQPIETAPQGTDKVLLSGPGWVSEGERFRPGDNGFILRGEDNTDFPLALPGVPTHWMPLPPPVI